MRVNAYQCLNCNDIIYSRARHDYRTCSCGKLSVDGGFDYVRITCESKHLYKPINLELPTTKQELYTDWNFRENRYGLVKFDATPS